MPLFNQQTKFQFENNIQKDYGEYINIQKISKFIKTLLDQL